MSEEQAQKALSTHVEDPKGFEADELDGELIIPRIKIIQALSQERKDKIADEGDILNSLTKDRLNGQVFIPIFKFNNNIWWKPRDEGGGMYCSSRDGKVGVPTDGSTTLMCLQCRKNEFDNTKTGKDSFPKCTKYINFFGFFRDSQLPVILSFGKTNYNQGKTMYSIAKVSLQNMWNNGYRLDEKKITKGGNEWYIVNSTLVGPTTDEERAYGRQLYDQFRGMDLKFDQGDESEGSSDLGRPEETPTNTEF